MGIEAVEADVEDAGAEAPRDQSGDELELLREPAARPRHRVRALQQVPQGLDGRQRLDLPSLHEVRQVVRARRARGGLREPLDEPATGLLLGGLAAAELEAERTLIVDAD